MSASHTGMIQEVYVQHRKTLQRTGAHTNQTNHRGLCLLIRNSHSTMVLVHRDRRFGDRALAQRPLPASVNCVGLQLTLHRS